MPGCRTFSSPSPPRGSDPAGCPRRCSAPRRSSAFSISPPRGFPWALSASAIPPPPRLPAHPAPPTSSSSTADTPLTTDPNVPRPPPLSPTPDSLAAPLHDPDAPQPPRRQTHGVGMIAIPPKAKKKTEPKSSPHVRRNRIMARGRRERGRRERGCGLFGGYGREGVGIDGAVSSRSGRSGCRPASRTHPGGEEPFDTS
ncbi:hypothetical protein FAIPA1_110048 [Frankia sp. AiPs1]